MDKNDVTSIDDEQLCKMVDCFLEQGFTYFDTAYFYHQNMSECADFPSMIPLRYWIRSLQNSLV